MHWFVVTTVLTQNKERKKEVNMSSKVTRRVRDIRRKAAEERQAIYDKLSTQEKLDRLPEDGAMKQRAKLEALLKVESAGSVKSKSGKTKQKQ